MKKHYRIYSYYGCGEGSKHGSKSKSKCKRKNRCGQNTINYISIKFGDHIVGIYYYSWEKTIKAVENMHTTKHLEYHNQKQTIIGSYFIAGQLYEQRLHINNLLCGFKYSDICKYTVDFWISGKLTGVFYEDDQSNLLGAMFINGNIIKYNKN